MRRAALAALLVLIITAPAVPATHFALYSVEVGDARADPTPGQTLEPDEDFVDRPGHPLHGVENRVTHGGFPGDGGRFLDARLVNYYGVPLYHVGVFPEFGALTREFLGKDRILVPGELRLVAWYGEWTDLDNDGFIDDYHDANCFSRCSQDEFRWRGAGSDHSESVVGFSITGATAFSRHVLNDYTAHTNAEQSWFTHIVLATDGGFLRTYQTVVVAGAQAAVDDPLGLDITDPEALIDVDTYEAVDREVEGLYLASLAVADALVVTPLQALVRDHVQPIIDFASDVIDDADPASITAAANAAVAENYPRYAKEPNHPEDDSEDRAIWSPLSDAYGSYNTYPGYADDYGLWLDVITRGRRCIGPYASAGGVSAKVDLWCPNLMNDVVSHHLAGEPTAGHLLWQQARSYLWYDRNGDTHLGIVCDPNDSEQFDADRNTCKPEHQPKWPHNPGTGSETALICQHLEGRGGTYTVTPIGGNWPDVLVIRDWAYAFRPLTEDGIEGPINHADPITLRWEGHCDIDQIPGRDAILFPQGMSIPVKVRAEFWIDGYSDPGRGITLGAQRVVDVDVIPGML